MPLKRYYGLSRTGWDSSLILLLRGLLAIQQNVVQNEKRQGEDNSPYGFTEYVIGKNLYPSDHPYNWEVIGEMEDLRNATIDDVKNYYDKFYGPNNATMVLAGDFNPDSVKLLIK